MAITMALERNQKEHTPKKEEHMTKTRSLLFKICHKLKRLIWESSFFAVVWTIQLTRNKCVFNSVSIDWSDVIEGVKIRTTTWVKANAEAVVFNINDFIKGVKSLSLSQKC